MRGHWQRLGNGWEHTSLYGMAVAGMESHCEAPIIAISAHFHGGRADWAKLPESEISCVTTLSSAVSYSYSFPTGEIDTVATYLRLVWCVWAFFLCTRILNEQPIIILSGMVRN